ncbi:MAG: YceI family protein [Ilumatobacteraceae bacterium]
MSTQITESIHTTDHPAGAATRHVDGVELPGAGAWRVDPGHADVSFVGRHFGLTRVRGRFTGIDGVATIGARLADSHVEVSIDMASVASGDRSRDDHLRSPDFFDVVRHPTATFRSTAISVDGTHAVMSGDLTIKGVTRPVRLGVDYLGHAVDPAGEDRLVFSAAGVLDREQWGLTWNMLLEAGGMLVSKEIRLEIDVELERAAL